MFRTYDNMLFKGDAAAVILFAVEIEIPKLIFIPLKFVLLSGLMR